MGGAVDVLASESRKKGERRADGRDAGAGVWLLWVRNGVWGAKGEEQGRGRKKKSGEEVEDDGDRDW